MTKGIKHTDVSTELTSTEFHADTAHFLASGTAFPTDPAPAEMDTFYRTDLHKWYIHNGTDWKELGVGGAPTLPGSPTTENTIGNVPASSKGTTVTTPAAANTKGAYAELVASSPADSSWILIMLARPSVGVDFLVDIATGAAGSEVVKIANLFLGHVYGGSNRGSVCYLLPFAIPAGTRVSARAQTNNASARTCEVSMLLLDGVAGGLTSSETGGALTASTSLTNFTTGNNAEGSWVTLLASTSGIWRFLLLVLVNSGGTVTGRSLIDIGTGASPTAVVADIQYLNPDDTTTFATVIPIPITIASGTKISIRGRSDGAVTLAAAVVGVY